MVYECIFVHWKKLKNKAIHLACVKKNLEELCNFV